MNGRMSLVVSAVVTVVVIGMIPVAAALAGDVTAGVGDVEVSHADDGNQGEENETTRDIEPGERFSGVVGVQKAELEGDVNARAFGVRLGNADTDEERANVIADQLDRNEDRLEEVSDRQNELRDRRDAGEISEGSYVARTATAAFQLDGVKLTTERSAEAADSLPDHVRDDRGIRAERIDALRDRASSLGGPEVAEMAREIGGNRTGAPMGPPHGEEPGTGIGPSGGNGGQAGNNGGQAGENGGETGGNGGQAQSNGGIRFIVHAAGYTSDP